MAKKNQQKPIGNPIRMRYPTCDDWSPNFERNCVELTVYTYHNTKPGVVPDGLIKMVVRGADDTVMGKYIKCPMVDYPAQIKSIEAWIRTIPNPVSKAWLLTQSFEWE